ncbi:MAG: uroporphyrinogen-III synthase [Candidatus Rokubacteria bacterium]|nr:uroporphyrinogen-III synthase [Candidatus Rokubacteria bacterium]
MSGDAPRPSLGGKIIAITEARRARELASLIEKLGGVPYSAPAVREVPRRDAGPARDVLGRVCRGEVAAIVFLTGVGTRAFLELAAGEGRREALLGALGGMLVAARGPKPIAVLREAGVRIDVVPAEPTSEGLLAALAGRELRGQAVAVQLYGDENPVLVDGLTAFGAVVLEIPLYEWALPEDVEPLARLTRELIAGRIDMIAFTSSPQVKHLFLVAAQLGLDAALAGVLRERVTVAVVGPVCEAALREHGITPAIQPAKGTMGALVHEIAAHLGPGERHGALPGRA